MKVAIHQPQYLPWLPYFLKIDESDVFIFLDTVDFQKNGLQNRNQIKTPRGAQWLTVPVRHKLGQKIRATEIDNTRDWRRKHWQTIVQCYGRAMAFKSYGGNLEGIYSRRWDNLSELNIALTKLLLTWMDIRTPAVRSSDMRATGVASDLILNLCREAGATHYLSGTGGQNYLNGDDFERAGIEIVFRPPVVGVSYPQMFPEAGFMAQLSALDLLLNCGKSWRDVVPELAGAG